MKVVEFDVIEKLAMEKFDEAKKYGDNIDGSRIRHDALVLMGLEKYAKELDELIGG